MAPYVSLLFLFLVQVISPGMHRTVVGDVPPCNADEREALLQFKHKLIDHGGMLSTWIGEDCCSWEGVVCSNQSGHVLEFNLYGDRRQTRYVEGEISPSLVRLKYLQELSLFGNDFRQSRIPEFLGSFEELRFLNLEDGEFVGAIPPHLGNLSKLETLRLGLNSLSGSIPPSMGRLSSCQDLDLSYNKKLSGEIPEYLGSFVQLRSLDLRFAGFTGTIPPQLGNLSKLEFLGLSGNYLSGAIPPSIGRLSSCSYLRLDRNNLSGEIPETLLQLHMLSTLYLDENSLQGTLTEAFFSNFSRLDSLSLGENKFELALSPEWNPPFRAGYLDLSSCKLGTGFPPWIRSQTTLVSLTLAEMGIQGPLPAWIWSFSPILHNIDLSKNNIFGTIPDPGSASPAMIILDSNKLEGPLPVFNTTNLDVLILSNNSLSGPIDHAVTPIIDLLILSHNNFSGTIPSSLCISRRLYALILSHNKLQGQVPDCFDAAFWMHVLQLDNNNLSGNIPRSLRVCSQMSIIDVSNNRFSGIFPGFIHEAMVNLKVLVLRSNLFHGEIPPNISNMSYLQVLDLSNNGFTGPIPTSFGDLAAMKNDSCRTGTCETIGYHAYGYETVVPLLVKGGTLEYAKQLRLVKHMDLSGNDLSGNIPLELGSLSALGHLNLSRNHLTGNIPRELTRLVSLESLDLSRNNLSGSIPSAFGNLSSLAKFDVSYNNLSGTIPIGSQFDTFDNTSFVGNPGLCGKPLDACKPLEDGNPPKQDIIISLYLLTGFAIGFVFDL